MRTVVALFRGRFGDVSGGTFLRCRDVHVRRCSHIIRVAAERGALRERVPRRLLLRERIVDQNEVRFKGSCPLNTRINVHVDSERRIDEAL